MSGFPKHIEPLATAYTVDGTGFSASEKVSLSNAWNIIKADKKKHATEIFTRFFLAYPRYLKHFKISDDRFNIEGLHSHPASVLESYRDLSEEGLWDAGKMNTLLTKLIKIHKNIKLSGADMNAMATIAHEYFKEVFAKYMTPTLETSLNKVRLKFSHGYENDDE